MPDVPAPVPTATPAAQSTNGAKPNGTATQAPAKGAAKATQPQAVGGKSMTEAPEAGEQSAAGADVDAIATQLKSKPWTFKRKDGREVRVDSVEYLKSLASQGFSATHEIEQARAAKAQAAEMQRRLEALQQDPERALEEVLGPERFNELATKRALERYEEDLKLRGVPEHIQQELREAKKAKLERDTLARKMQAEAEQRQRQQQEAEMESAKNLLLSDGVAALQKVGFSEKPPASTIMRLAPYMAEAVDMGLGAEHAAKLLHEDMQREHASIAASYVSANDGAGLEAWLGKDAAKLLMRHHLARLKGAAAAPVDNGVPQSQPQEPRQPTPEELRRWLRNGK